jgi:lysophospholipase L1-like esterase
LWGWPGYVYQYQSYVQSDTGATVTLSDLGQLGWTSGDLLNALNTNFFFSEAVRNSQIVTLDIGGNDFLDARNSYKARTCGGSDNQDCLRNEARTFKANWAAIVAKILSLRSMDRTSTRTINLYNPFVNVDKAVNTVPANGSSDFAVFKPYADELNSFMCTRTRTNPIPCADVYHKFNGPNGDIDPRTFGYISFDGLHPNTAGHRAMADLLRDLGYRPLSNR